MVGASCCSSSSEGREGLSLSRGASRPARRLPATAVLGQPARAVQGGLPARTARSREAATAACSQRHAKGREPGCCGAVAWGAGSAMSSYMIAVAGTKDKMTSMEVRRS